MEQKDDESPGGVTMFMIRRFRWGLILTSLVFLAVMGPAVAGPKKGGGGGGGSSASLAINEPAPYTFGQDITFDASGSRAIVPWIRVKCRQGGELVYFEANPVGGNYFVDDVFTLGPTQAWTSGDAGCSADLGFYAKNGRWRNEASLSFSVND